ncbi:MAG: hypothetical protein JJV94_04005 [Sulfurospirillum sp.]|nr:hypothetical protein [Sulfurospirillum sp.]
MAEALMIENNHRDFWKEVKIVEGRSKPRAPQIDDKITQKEIADVFLQKNMRYFTTLSNQTSI